MKATLLYKKKKARGTFFWYANICRYFSGGMAGIPDIVLGMANIQYIYSLVNTRCWGPAYVAV